jgi:hypothetical protein
VFSAAAGVSVDLGVGGGGGAGGEGGREHRRRWEPNRPAGSIYDLAAPISPAPNGAELLAPGRLSSKLEILRVNHRNTQERSAMESYCNQMTGNQDTKTAMPVYLEALSLANVYFDHPTFCSSRSGCCLSAFCLDTELRRSISSFSLSLSLSSLPSPLPRVRGVHPCCQYRIFAPLPTCNTPPLPTGTFPGWHRFKHKTRC